MSTNSHDNQLKHKLSRRHQILLDKITRQRHTLSNELQQLRASFSFADNSLSLLGKLKQLPLIGIIGIAAIWLIKPSRLIGIMSKGFAAWQVWRSIMPLISRVWRFVKTPTELNK
jgi:hypothetical protein